MERRMNRNDFLFAYFFIVLIAFTIAAFFFGWNVGEQRVLEQYKAAAIEANQEEANTQAYSETELASFYHIVYSPYNQYMQKIWNADSDLSAPFSSSNIKIQAKEALAQISATSVSDRSPLLSEAQLSYMKSLNLFIEALDDSPRGFNALFESKLWQQGMKESLKAQSFFYEAMGLWERDYANGGEIPANIKDRPMPIEEWRKLSIHQKNWVVAMELYYNGWTGEFTPQDVTVGLDALVLSGETESLKINDVPRAMKLLFAVQSVRPGDFKRQQKKFYADANFPMIPLYQQ